MLLGAQPLVYIYIAKLSVPIGWNLYFHQILKGIDYFIVRWLSADSKMKTCKINSSVIDFILPYAEKCLLWYMTQEPVLIQHKFIRFNAIPVKYLSVLVYGNLRIIKIDIEFEIHLI